MKSTTSFQQKVFAVVRKIPRGKTMTYKEVAKAIGSPRAYRAVGNALNKNPYVYPGRANASRRADQKWGQTALLVPCHRVIRSDGSVGGFAQGTRKKVQLLRREGAR